MVDFFKNVIDSKSKDISKLTFVKQSFGDDSSIIIKANNSLYGGGLYLNNDPTTEAIATENQLIAKYRSMSKQPDCSLAIRDIVNEAIITDEAEPSVTILLDSVEIPEKIKDKIVNEFKYILKLLNFNNYGADIFERWYIDGRIAYHKVFDDSDKKLGILKLIALDSMKLKKMREETNNSYEVYFVYNENKFSVPSNTNSYMYSKTESGGFKIHHSRICYVTSRLYNDNGTNIVSHLDKAIKPLNHLRFMEDALVIYRITRSTEKRIFKIEVGNTPPRDIDKYMADISSKYKNNMVYDTNSGTIVNDVAFRTMTQDFFIPVRDGKGCDISPLSGGDNLGQIDDIIYFRKIFYKSLNVPISRLEESSGFSLGRSTEITREEVAFQKFIAKLRRDFSSIFKDILKTQVCLKGIMTSDEWDDIEDNIAFRYLKENYFAELKELEVMSERINLVTNMDSFAGKYISQEKIMKDILRLSDEEYDIEIERMKKEASEGMNDNGLGNIGGLGIQNNDSEPNGGYNPDDSNSQDESGDNAITDETNSEDNSESSEESDIDKIKF